MAIKPRIVLFGLGSIGRRHARLLQERGDVELRVFEPNDEAFRAGGSAGLPRYATLEEALASKPEITWICSPTPCHAQQTIAALEHGCHVFCEKPMADNVEDALRMIAAAERAGRVLNVGFHLHFWEGALRMKQAIDSGRVGQVLHLHARVGTYLTLRNSASRYQETNPGSIFLDYSHQPDLFYWLLGSVPEKVFVSAIQAGNLQLSSAPNVADILLIYDTPVRASIHLNYAEDPDRHTYDIVGDRAWMHADLITGQIRIGDRSSRKVEISEFVQDKDSMVRAEQAAFFEAIAGLREPSTSGADGLIATAVCEAAIRSWQSGEAVHVNYGSQQ
jgi:predicted dehydrogenase